MGVEILSYLVAFVLAQYVLLLFVMGHDAVRSPQWEHRFREAGAIELYRRGFFTRKHTVEELSAVEHMIGPDRYVCPFEDNGDIYDVITVLSGSADRGRLGVELDRQRAWLLRRALERQRRRVIEVYNIKWVYRFWVAQRVLSSFEVAVRGAIWMIPRSIAVLGNFLGTYNRHAGVSAVLFGSVWWALTAIFTSEPIDAGLVGTVGEFVGAGVIGGVLYAVVRVWWMVVVTRFGDPSRWNRRGIAWGAGSVALLGIVFGLGLSGILPRGGLALSGFVDRIDDEIMQYLGGLLFLSAIGWRIYGCVRSAMNPMLVARDRLAFIMVGTVLTGVCVLLVGMLVGTHVDGFISVAMWLVVGGFGLGSGVALLSVLDWWKRYRALVRAGYPFRRYGFRIWALMSWLLAFTAVAMWSELSPISRADSLTYVVEQEALFVISMAVVLSFFPGVVTTYLFVRSVGSQYRRLSMWR